MAAKVTTTHRRPIRVVKAAFWLADWFYHASKPKSDVPVDAPAPSQIPGLDGVGPDSDDERNDEFAPQYRVFDTDSKYVRLAKAGGRKSIVRRPN